ncbi:hypothetical protein Lupro_06705 [Lutibacter profundi]|uniref:Uncharacterized protein n=1 Tax=Lutibacter profundi TaxID=1622118 RepID=A0A0X8G6J3_9FLAO|nr:hypothetical protein [Lutibacter profundi]AMC10955.1 hypothetical protein Lupro_06705 [Lutibacter profundi]
MYQIENKQFKKTNFDKNHKIVDYQYIKVGNIVKNNNGFSLEINMKKFDKKGNLKKEETSKYSCNTKEGGVFMGIIPFINKPSKKININVLSKNSLYPSNFQEINVLDDYKIIATYKTGFLGVTSITDMNYINRNIKKTDDNTYTILGEIDIKIEVAGVNISNISYKSEEKIDTLKGIVFQKFVENSGSYFTIQLINE